MTDLSESFENNLAAPELRQRHSAVYSFSYTRNTTADTSQLEPSPSQTPESTLTPTSHRSGTEYPNDSPSSIPPLTKADDGCNKSRTLNSDKKETVEKKEKVEKEEDGGFFECNICIEMAGDPVVTLCGHLFCWSCLSKWMNSGQARSNACPVCTSLIKKDSVIPIYAKGNKKDPRSTDFSPGDRPAGQRRNAPPQNSNPFSFFPFTFGGDQAIQFNVGFFPFFFPFGIQMNVPGRNGGRGGTGHDQSQDEIGGFLSRLFLMIATLILVSIILY